MKKYVLFLLSLFLSVTIFAQADSSSCAKFKKGLFTYRDDSTGTIILKRTAKRQEETNKKTGVIVKFRLRWVSSCSYELKQLWSNSKALRKNNGGVSLIIISKAGSNQYEYTCDCKTAADIKSNSGVVYKIK